jgi:hypothetical protein
MISDASLDDKLAGSVAFCTMCAVAVAGWQLLRQARCGRRRTGGDQAGDRALFRGAYRSRSTRPEGGSHRRCGLLYALDAAALAG